MKTRHSLTDYVNESGFQHTRRLAHLFVGGSELHGAKLGGTDDHDIYGVFIEPADRTIGILGPYEHFVWSTSGNERRNTAEDVDITLYTLRKWARLAAKGNPTCLHFLFANNESDNSRYAQFWDLIRVHGHRFLAKSHINAFVGFVDAQLGRLTGERGRGKKGQRPELETKFGYDTKAGMHSMRLLYEVIELMQTGKITFPRPEKQLLIKIRQGAWSIDRLTDEATRMIATAKDEAQKSSLPDEVDREAINNLITNIYLEAWC